MKLPKSHINILMQPICNRWGQGKLATLTTCGPIEVLRFNAKPVFFRRARARGGGQTVAPIASGLPVGIALGDFSPAYDFFFQTRRNDQ